MHIDSLYCSTYKQNTPITGNVVIKTETGQTQIKLSEDECRRIQDVAVEAYERNRDKLVKELQTNTPALIQLADFREIPADEGIPF